MNLRQTAEVAALVATSAAHIVENPQPIPTSALHAYWKQSRTRLKCWFAGLRAARASDDGRPQSRSLPQQSQLIALCREILVTEMLTRVWSTILRATDDRQQMQHAESAAVSVYQGHLEARNEVLRLLAADDELSPADQASLDQFRRRIERWTDALIGPLVAAYGLSDYAFDHDRAADFAESALQDDLRGAAAVTTPLLIAGVTSAFPRKMDADQERAVLNRAVVRSILAAFPPAAFHNDGRLKSVGQGRLERSSRQPESSGTSRPESPAVGQVKPTKGLSFLQLRHQQRSTEPEAD